MVTSDSSDVPSMIRVYDCDRSKDAVTLAQVQLPKPVCFKEHEVEVGSSGF